MHLNQYINFHPSSIDAKHFLNQASPKFKLITLNLKSKRLYDT